MEMPLHNLNFLCTATERTNTRKEEKLGKLQTLSSTNQTVIKALITSLCCTKSFLPFYGQSGNTWHGNSQQHDTLRSIYLSNRLYPPGAKPSPNKICRAVAPARALVGTHHALLRPCTESSPCTAQPRRACRASSLPCCRYTGMSSLSCSPTTP